MTAPLPPNATIGIIGGGQLGRMSALAAARLGYRTCILAETADAPACLVAADCVVGRYDDPASLRELAARSDVISFEFENVPAAGLDLLATLRPVHPAPQVLRISQDRVAEKTFLNAAGVATAPWAEITDAADLPAALARIGLPAVLKTTRLGYDGKGQARVASLDEALAAFATLAPKPLVAEGFVDFAAEISVIVARGSDGTVRSFAVTENRHRDHILDLSFAPARIPPDIAATADALARKVAEAIGLVGVLAVEMFIDRDGKVLANEIAPRPHNSGHWTIDACTASQFELHVRAIAGLPLPDPGQHSDAVMKNLVGPEEIALWPRILATPGLIPHHYGKRTASPGRKLGHVTTLFGRGALPGDSGVADALGVLGRHLR